MHSFEPRITIGVILDFERMTGVKMFEDVGSVTQSMTNLTSLLYCSIKHQYPKLSFSKFIATLKPEELADGAKKVGEELVNFFQSIKKEETESQETET